MKHITAKYNKNGKTVISPIKFPLSLDILWMCTHLQEQAAHKMHQLFLSGAHLEEKKVTYTYINYVLTYT